MGHKESCEGGCMMKLVVGGLIGAGLAILLAPQAGKKTRKYLTSLAEEMGGKANEAVSEFAEIVSDFVDHASDRASDFLKEKEGLTKESKKMLLAALEKAQEKLEEQRKRLADSI
ncbi:YtxH domain-containing protein [Geomonas propionica]|uniref:YtxH domain-containing protein n=1 Tax=Geomonas propionica TaxID=2798582 RepID=A0ABS0YTB7_9BACT|nr:YtxH domain-containing protein [Geomonas propionica]MBJ6800750.1 YtxH domain-containing protein [Geomonas propionica]